MTASAAWMAMLSPSGHATLEDLAIVGFKNSQAGVEQITLGHNDDVEAGRNLVSTEDLSYQTFSAVSLDRATQLFRRRDPQPQDREFVGQDENGAVATVDPRAASVHLLELG